MTAPQHVDLCPGPFEDTQFDAVVDVETSDDCMDNGGKPYLSLFFSYIQILTPPITFVSKSL